MLPRVIAATLAGVVAVTAIVALWPRETDGPDVRTQDATVDVPRSPDAVESIPLDVTLYVPESTPAPAVLLPHGFGGTKDSVAGQARELAEHGFVVLTYTARGFGESGGMIWLNDPDREVADAQHLLDFLEKQPTVQTDSAGDPVVGVTGSSYGGALALQLAGTDDRVDAIAPVMTYNDLEHALLPNELQDRAAPEETPGETSVPDTPAGGELAGEGVFKQGWAGTLFSGGMGGTGTAGPLPDAPEPGDTRDDLRERPGTADPSGTAGPGTSGSEVPDQARPSLPQMNGTVDPCGRFAAPVCRAYTEVATTSTAGEQTRELLRRVSPAALTGAITAPTLLVQGTRDTLFGLNQADANARQITQAGGEVSMIWYAGGHDGGAPGPQLRETIADWLAYRLTGSGDDPVPAFRYDVQGTFEATRAPSVRVVEAESYPGLHGDSTPREAVPLSGPQQRILYPPGGMPAAISGLPGLNQLIPGGLGALDLPEQTAQFTTHALDDQLMITGSSTVTLQVAAAAAAGTGDAVGGNEQDAVLFAKLYDVAPDGTRRLPGDAVAPVRVPELPADGSPVEITVNLPGTVRPVEAGHRLQLVVTTTDLGYASEEQAAAYEISLAGDPALRVPSVPGTEADTGLPVPQLLGIGGLLLAALVISLVAALRRGGIEDPDPALADVPLRIDNLTKTYGGSLTAVSDLSFRVERGQVLGLLGPNGAGKTTTLRMLMGLVSPTSGEMRIFGHRVYPGAPVLSRVGAFVEGPGFLPHASGRKNLELYWAATGRPRHSAHLTEAMEIAGLGDAIDRKVRTYSQGMRQRLAIAQAMLGLPELLVLDEPTNGLDPPQIHQMREVMRRYAATGRTVLVSSHLLAEVEQTATHVVVMHHGTAVADGAVGEIVAAGGEASFVVDDTDAAAAALHTVEGMSDVEVADGKVHVNLGGIPRSVAVAALVHAGVSVEQAGPRRRLEDAFLQLVAEEGDAR
ncbi:alpha/beta fold hydrolase [Haloechinothrix sp. LS1_15]|nr:alpha/beta fold hydrolase [Haloechinothrix sp. LS1_15]